MGSRCSSRSRVPSLTVARPRARDPRSSRPRTRAWCRTRPRRPGESSRPHRCRTCGPRGRWHRARRCRSGDTASTVSSQALSPSTASPCRSSRQTAPSCDSPLPAFSEAECVGGGSEALDVAGGTLLEGISIRVLRDDEVDLAPGEWMVLGDAAEQCLRLAPGRGWRRHAPDDGCAEPRGGTHGSGRSHDPLHHLRDGVGGPDSSRAKPGSVAVPFLARRERCCQGRSRLPSDFERMSQSRVPDRAGPPPPDYWRYRHRAVEGGRPPHGR